MLKKYLKNEKGLTLIELLAVIVILGIIAAIAVPSIGNVINKTEEKAAYADAQQIIESARLYITSENPTFTSNVLTLDQDDTEFQSYYDKARDFSLTVTKETNGQLSFKFTALEDITIPEVGLTEEAITQKLK
ncbi:prepilin-type N-terminal cleavage/methylation domain-containing protein [Bacillus timonensis]|uniref:Prepilin-type N-terminal cleavage/methylation domain-containing protein n=1 Tax=Bacillus timonensis TaxID=1033734 RepID=A0A4S3Q0B3_9BACI|nr:prepilin-type N-terminal cleavage/methylation domain-containing protein [Bacillus timonensis]THE15296.1 prepilin-type N-terminal cleavage/methylation domain-containing protein [Bacillus timonensis]